MDYQEHIKLQQINWIGRSEGAEIDFPLIGIPVACAVCSDLRLFSMFYSYLTEPLFLFYDSVTVNPAPGIFRQFQEIVLPLLLRGFKQYNEQLHTVIAALLSRSVTCDVRAKIVN